MTEETLSATFGMPLVLQHEAGRWAARRRTRSRARAAGLTCGSRPAAQ